MAMVISLKTIKAQEVTTSAGSQEANKIEYKAEGLKDPFQEEEIEAPGIRALPSMTIQGIVWGGSFPQAIINNKVVRVGDTIEGVEITDIDKNRVTVLFENQKYTLSVSSPVSSREPWKENP